MAGNTNVNCEYSPLFDENASAIKHKEVEGQRSVKIQSMSMKDK